jgi:hypothetical protein
MQEVLARGVNFIYTKEFILNKYGIEAWKLLLQSLSEEDVSPIFSTSLSANFR